MRRLGDRAMTPAERQALRRLRYRAMREELERLRKENEQLRSAIESEIAAWLRAYAEEYPSYDDFLTAADAIEAGEHRREKA
jgi:hypothetical protein